MLHNSGSELRIKTHRSEAAVSAMTARSWLAGCRAAQTARILLLLAGNCQDIVDATLSPYITILLCGIGISPSRLLVSLLSPTPLMQPYLRMLQPCSAA